MFISRPETAGYKALEVAPYTDDDDASLANNLLCPRYAENDTSSAPPSPASIESFDVLDSIAWRRGYTSRETGAKARTCDAVRKRWRKNRAQLIALLLVFALLLLGCAVGAVLALRYETGRTAARCVVREGGERCAETAWARCVAGNGVGFCEGVM